MSKPDRDKGMVLNFFTTEIDDDKWLKRLFFYSKIICFMMPCLGAFWVYFTGQIRGQSFAEALAMDPFVNIVFLMSMITAFVAFKVKDIELCYRDCDYKSAVLNFFVLFVAELLVMNLMLMFMLALLFFKSKAVYGYTIKGALKELNFFDFWDHTKLSFIILALNGFCLYLIISRGLLIGVNG